MSNGIIFDFYLGLPHIHVSLLYLCASLSMQFVVYSKVHFSTNSVAMAVIIQHVVIPGKPVFVGETKYQTLPGRYGMSV